LASEAELQARSLKVFKDQVDVSVIKFTDAVLKGINSNPEAVKNTTTVSNIVDKYKVKSTLTEFRSFLESMSNGFEIQQDFKDALNNLDQVMSMMFELCEYIPRYEDIKRTGNFIANLAKLETGKEVIFEREQQELYDQLQIAHLGSQIYSEWSTLSENYLQWVYPFADKFAYIADTEPLNYLDGIGDFKEMLQIVIPVITRWVKGIKDQVNLLGYTVDETIDKSVKKGDFINEYPEMPFYVWPNENHTQKIVELLSGKKVQFTSSPEETAYQGLTAVKFSVAEIVPQARHSAKQQEIDKLMQNITVHMWHSGVSKFIYQGDVTEMVGLGEDIKIEFNYKRDKDGKRTWKNEVAEKLSQGDYVLSPYTTWHVQYLKFRTNLKVDYKQLVKYAKDVDIALIGHGSSVYDPTLIDYTDDAEGKSSNTGQKGFKKSHNSKRRHHDFK